MTSTNDGKDVKSNQISGHKSKSYYIELYTSLEKALSSDNSLEERTRHVCEAWRRVYSLYQHSATSTHPHLLSWLQRHTANTVLQSKWAKSKNEQKRLADAIDALVSEATAASAGRPRQPWEQTLLQRAAWFRKALENPWDNLVLKSLINPDSEPVSDQQVLEWLISEHGVVLVTRLQRMVAAGNCDDLALLLASAVMDRARAAAPARADERAGDAVEERDETGFVAVLEREASFTSEEWELLTDIELVLLLKTDKRPRCIELAKLTPLRDGFKMVERLRKRLEMAPRDKKLWKHAKEVATIVTQVVIARCMVLGQCGGAARDALYWCARALARLVAPAALRGVSTALAAPAATARHLHTFCAALSAECKELKTDVVMKPFICELYIRAITAGMNELEQLKLKAEKESEARLYEQTLAGWFTQLGGRLAASARLRAECALTAFSVHPARAHYERVARAPAAPAAPAQTIESTPSETTSEYGSWANDSRTQSNLVKTSETLQLKQSQRHHANVLSIAILTEGEALGLEPELCQDLAVLLSGPRVKTLSWDMDREVLLENCRSYMEKTHGGTRAVTTELKYLNLDPNAYQHLPEEEDDENDVYYGIEKGYEHEVQFEEPEEIWQNAFFDPEQTESAESEVERSGKKKSKASFVGSEEDEDPLSTIADAKREKKKRAKDKERKKTHKRDDSKDGSKERRKDKKPKKERKIKSEQPTTGSLTSLLGMKITKVSSPVQDGEKRVRKKKERRRESTFSYVSVADSDHDNQGKWHVSDDPNVLVDGVFSMDELKSPERLVESQNPIDNTRTTNISSERNSVINDIKTRPTSSPAPTTSSDSDVSRAKSPYLTPNQIAHRHVVNPVVKSSLHKLLQFRRNQNKMRAVVRPAPAHTPTQTNTLVGMKVYNPEEVPKVYLNKKQCKQLEMLSNDVNSLFNEVSTADYKPKTPNESENELQNKQNLYNTQKYNRQYTTLNDSQKLGQYTYSSGKIVQQTILNQSPTSVIQSNYASPTKTDLVRPHVLNFTNNQTFHKSMQNLSCEKQDLPKKPLLINDPNYFNQHQGKGNTSQLSPKILSNTVIKPPMQTSTTRDDFNNSQMHSNSHRTYVSKTAQNSTQITNLKSDVIRYGQKQISSMQNITEMPGTSHDATRRHIPIPNDITHGQANTKLYSVISHSEALNSAQALYSNNSQTSRSGSFQNRNDTKTPQTENNDFDEFLLEIVKSMHTGTNGPDKNVAVALNKDVKLSCVQTPSAKRTDSINQSAKQLQQKKSDNAPNTFSRLSYMHKNKLNEKVQPTDAVSLDIDRSVLEHKILKAKCMKNEVTISRVGVRNANTQNPGKITNRLDKSDSKLKRNCPVLSSMLESSGAPNIQTYSKVSAASHNPSDSQPNREDADLLLLLRNQTILKSNSNTIDTSRSDGCLNQALINLNSQAKVATQVSSTRQTLVGTKVKNINILDSCSIKKEPEDDEWKRVMDAIRAQKTEPLGPNALDLALKKGQRRIAHTSARTSGKGVSVPAHSSSQNTDTKKRELYSSKPNPTVRKANTEKYSQVSKRPRDAEIIKKVSPEIFNRIEIHNKHSSSNMTKETPNTSVIQNTEYDMLEDLIDDDLRREIGEILSDEEAYISQNISVKGKSHRNIPKTNVCKATNVSKEKPHSVNPKTVISKHQTNTNMTDNNIRSVENTSISNYPNMIINNPNHPVASLVQNTPVSVKSEATRQYVPNTTIITDQIAQNTANNIVTQIEANQYVNNIVPTNVIIAPVPQQAPVVVIRQDLVYDPYPTIRIHESQVNAELCAINPNIFAVNAAPNIAVYQTTQFASPVINPIIIGNATTTTNVSNATAMGNKHVPPDSVKKDINMPDEDSISLETALRLSDAISENPEQQNLEPPNLDFNMNRNCERKVLSQVQENLSNDVEKESHKTRLSNDDVPIKSEQDEERIKLKRQSLINRNVSHSGGYPPIALTYAPLSKTETLEKILQHESPKNGTVKSNVRLITNAANDIVTVNANVTRPPPVVNNENIESTTQATSAKENKKSCRRIWLRSSNKITTKKVSPVKHHRIPLKRNTTKLPIDTIKNTTIKNLENGNKDSIIMTKRNRILIKNKPNTKQPSISTELQQNVVENDELIDFEKELDSSILLKPTAAVSDKSMQGPDLSNAVSKQHNKLEGIKDTENSSQINNVLEPTVVIQKLEKQLVEHLVTKGSSGKTAVYESPAAAKNRIEKMSSNNTIATVCDDAKQNTSNKINEKLLPKTAASAATRVQASINSKNKPRPSVVVVQPRDFQQSISNSSTLLHVETNKLKSTAVHSSLLDESNQSKATVVDNKGTKETPTSLDDQKATEEISAVGPSPDGQKATVETLTVDPSLDGQKATEETSTDGPSLDGQNATEETSRDGPSLDGQNATEETSAIGPSLDGQNATEGTSTIRPSFGGQNTTDETSMISPSLDGQKAAEETSAVTPSLGDKKATKESSTVGPSLDGQKATEELSIFSPSLDDERIVRAPAPSPVTLSNILQMDSTDCSEIRTDENKSIKSDTSAFIPNVLKPEETTKSVQSNRAAISLNANIKVAANAESGIDNKRDIKQHVQIPPQERPDVGIKPKSIIEEDDVEIIETQDSTAPAESNVLQTNCEIKSASKQQRNTIQPDESLLCKENINDVLSIETASIKKITNEIPAVNMNRWDPNLKPSQMDAKPEAQSKNLADTVRNTEKTGSVNNTSQTSIRSTKNIEKPGTYMKGDIKIEEIPLDDPDKKLVRISLPNGKIFKATIFGKIQGDFDSLFAQPSMRAILAGNVRTDGKRYTINYKQVQRTLKDDPTQRVAKIEDLNIKEAASQPVDTVNLISDDEDEVPTRSFNTEFGKYTSNLDQEIIALHQKKFDQKCEVKMIRDDLFKSNRTKPKSRTLPSEKSSLLTRNKSKLLVATTTNMTSKDETDSNALILPNSALETHSHLELANTITPKTPDVIEIDDSSNDSPEKQVPESSDNINVEPVNISVLTNLLLKDLDVETDKVKLPPLVQTGAAVVNLKGALLQDLGIAPAETPVIDITENDEENVKNATHIEEPNKRMDKNKLVTDDTHTYEKNNITDFKEQFKLKKCAVKVVKCDNLIKKYEIMKNMKHCFVKMERLNTLKLGSETEIIRDIETYELNQDNAEDFIDFDVDELSGSPQLSRCPSVSILNNWDDDNQPVLKIPDCTSPVMEIYDTIVHLRNKLKYKSVRESQKELKPTCDSEWTMTKYGHSSQEILLASSNTISTVNHALLPVCDSTDNSKVIKKLETPKLLKLTNKVLETETILRIRPSPNTLKRKTEEGVSDIVASKVLKLGTLALQTLNSRFRTIIKPNMSGITEILSENVDSVNIVTIKDLFKINPMSAENMTLDNQIYGKSNTNMNAQNEDNNERSMIIPPEMKKEPQIINIPVDKDFLIENRDVSSPSLLSDYIKPNDENHQVTKHVIHDEASGNQSHSEQIASDRDITEDNKIAPSPVSDIEIENREKEISIASNEEKSENDRNFDPTEFANSVICLSGVTKDNDSLSPSFGHLGDNIEACDEFKQNSIKITSEGREEENDVVCLPKEIDTSDKDFLEGIKEVPSLLSDNYEISKIKNLKEEVEYSRENICVEKDIIEKYQPTSSTSIDDGTSSREKQLHINLDNEIREKDISQVNDVGNLPALSHTKNNFIEENITESNNEVISPPPLSDNSVDTDEESVNASDLFGENHLQLENSCLPFQTDTDTSHLKEIPNCCLDEIYINELTTEVEEVVIATDVQDDIDIFETLTEADKTEISEGNVSDTSSHKSDTKSPDFVDSKEITFNYHDYTKRKHDATENFVCSNDCTVLNDGDRIDESALAIGVNNKCTNVMEQSKKADTDLGPEDTSTCGVKTNEKYHLKPSPNCKYELIQEDDLLTVKIISENSKDDIETQTSFVTPNNVEKETVVPSPCSNNTDDINLKGYEFEDVYVFPLSRGSSLNSTVSNDSLTRGSNSEVINNSVLDDLHNINFHVKEPEITYSRKRKMKMREVKVTAKKYRKGKNIDCSKQTQFSMVELAYVKEYKRLLEYCSSVKFSYSRPFHKECVELDDLMDNRPIRNVCCDVQGDVAEEHLFVDLEDYDSYQPDPVTQTFVEEISYEYNKIDAAQEDSRRAASETNFNMGFGEGSGRVIQILKNQGESNISAATLSDVKQSQPVFKSVDPEDCNDVTTNNDDQIMKIRQHVHFIELRNKVRQFFKKSTFELKSEWMLENSKYKLHPEDFPFGLCSLDYLKPFATNAIVQVVQVGQLPVSAAAQNPVTCDPRVTQVSDASPSQCSVDNSPNDDSQSEIKTEYTELTTADLTLPLQEYAQQNQTSLSSQGSNVELIEQTISLEMEIKAEESPEIKQELPDIKEEKSNSSDELHTLTNAMPEHMDYSFENNTSKSDTNSVNYESSEQKSSETFSQQRPHNGTTEKTNQIAHAMNAAGITTTPETVTNTRAHALVNILSQKIRQGSVNTTQTTTNTYSKTSINAMALQQALAQILPPPLNQTGSSDNNQTQSTPVGPQVLHIVQGKNASGNQITLVDNSQQSVISTPNATQVLHIVQNKNATPGQVSNGTLTPQANSFSGISLVDAGLQQGGNQLLHIVNTGNQKTNSPGQLLKRVNLLTNLTNVQGSNEQKMVQFVCKSADGKAIQLNAPHQRSMVLRLQPIETPSVQTQPAKSAESQELSPSPNSTAANKECANQQEIKSRSIYEENYAKFIQNSSSKTPGLEKSTSLPKFNQAFGKPVFQEGSQKQGEAPSNNSHLPSVNTNSENAECPAHDNAINLEHMGNIASPPLLIRKPVVTSQSQSNIVQQIKQTIAPMNIQTMHGGVIYTRQIPVNIGGGQTINLITVPSTELINDETSKLQSQTNQGEIEPSIIKIVPQSQTSSNTESSQEDSNNHASGSNENPQTPQPQPVLTQMRIKLPMLSKAPQMVPGARVVRPSFFQIQRNVIGGANQPVYQQLVLTAAPPLGQQTIRLPAQAPRPVKVPSESQSSSSESQMSTSTLEQLREFDMVLEQVKERSTSTPSANSNNSSFKIHTSSSDTTDGNASSNCSTESTSQVLYSIGNNQSLNVAYVNRKTTVTTPTTSTYVRSPDSSGIADSPTSTHSTHVQIQHTVTTDSSPTEMSSQSKPAKVGSKSKSRPKSTSNPPNTLKLSSSVPPKTTSQKPLEDEQTTQRILYILAEYKEQVENSPDKDKPAPRRRSNPPSNPGSSKRKKSSSSRRSGTRDMSPVHGEDTCRTMGSEDSSCGTSQGDCNESCLDSHSPQDSPRKVARKITFDQDIAVTQPRPQPQRNVIVADGQTIAVARGTPGKPATAVLMPANYIVPVSMVKGGQQIAIVTNRGPKLLTVGGEGGATNALLLQRLIGPAGLKPVLARPGVRHVRLPTAALHNLQAFNLATATTVQPPDSTASPTPGPTPPELVDTRANSSPWTDRDEVKPERSSSPEGSEPWNLPSTDAHEYTYEETVRTDNMDRTVLVVQKKDGSHKQHRLAHVSAAALRHKYAILEHELRLQKSLSEECEDLGVDSPSASELFPEAELLFANSPAHEHNQEHHSHTPQPLQSSIPQPDMDDQIATDHLIPREIDVSLGLGDVGIVAVSEDGSATIALDQEEFARSHPNTTFHSEPTDGEVQPFTIAGLKGRHITSTIFHSNSAPATVLMTAPQATVISQAPEHSVKYEIENMIHSIPSSHNNDMNLSSVLVKDDGLTRFDSILTDSRELHLTNTASAIVHSSGNATQVIRRVCYEDDKRERDARYLIDEPDNLIAGDDAKMIAEDSSRDATLESMADVDDDRSSPERHAELFWESNSASERSESRRPLDFSSDSDKCCKSPSFDETNSTDSSVGTHMRLDSVIKEARKRERSGSADGSSADDTHPPLRTYPPKRLYHPLEGEVERSLSGKTRAGERSPDSLEVRRRASGRGVVKRGCHCCNGSPAPPRPKKPRQRKPTLDFTNN